ncbi:MAG TPA: gamma-glutamylcyclotransferase, partial [Verrucomicrobiales bacterium]|nr:gamma-glutamylcyclotransferase [Verrucomicrobiales bacterium]
MSPEYLFVYGTLRRDGGHEMSRFLAAHAEHLGPATFQGRMYRISWYPGVVPSADPADRVHGDLFELGDAATALPKLDDFEGVGPGHVKPQEYIRRPECVTLPDGRSVTAWIYVFNRPV